MRLTPQDYDTKKKKLAGLLLSCLHYGAPTKTEHTLEYVRKKLIFQYQDDFKKMRSCIDLLEDTEDALINFFEYQLVTDRTKSNLGEIYLRLYGVLNAVYLQMQSIIEIAEIVRYPSKQTIKEKIEALKIIEIRNIAGAHTVNFITNRTKKFKTPKLKKNHFKLTQTEIREDGRNLTLVDGYGNYEQVNLYVKLLEYCKVSDSLLLDIISNYTDRLFKNNPSLKEDFIIYIADIKRMKNNYRKFDQFKGYKRKELTEAKKLIKEIKKKVV